MRWLCQSNNPSYWVERKTECIIKNWEFLIRIDSHRYVGCLDKRHLKHRTTIPKEFVSRVFYFPCNHQSIRINVCVSNSVQWSPISDGWQTQYSIHLVMPSIFQPLDWNGPTWGLRNGHLKFIVARSCFFAPWYFLCANKITQPTPFFTWNMKPKPTITTEAGKQEWFDRKWKSFGK